MRPTESPDWKVTSRRMTTFRKAALLVLPTIAMACAVALIWMLDHRLEGYGVRLSSYATIYQPAEIPTVAGFSRKGNELTLKLSAAATLDDAQGAVSQNARISSSSRQPTLRLQAGMQRHKLILSENRNSPAAWVATIFTTDSNPVVFSTSDLVVGEFRQLPLRKLVATPEDFPPTDIDAAKHILEQSALNNTDTATMRLKTTWTMLDTHLAGAHGNPPPLLSRTPALQQYKMAMNGEVLLDCANFAEIFVLFGTAAGLSVRIVDAIRETDGVVVAAHTFNEVFLPELGRWAYVDLSLRTMSIRSEPDGLPMNAVQLAQLHQAGADQGLFAITQQDGNLQAVPYREFTDFIRLHITSNATFVFHTIYRERYTLRNLVRRYLILPEPAYALHGNNQRHYLKLAAFLGVIATSLIWGLLVLQWVFSRRNAIPSNSTATDSSTN